MTARSTSDLEVLEERNTKRPKRQSREVQRLLETAGPDRPDTKIFEDSGGRRTRSRSAEFNTETTPTGLRRPRRLSGPKDCSEKPSETEDTESEASTKGRPNISPGSEATNKLLIRQSGERHALPSVSPSSPDAHQAAKITKNDPNILPCFGSSTRGEEVETANGGSYGYQQESRKKSSEANLVISNGPRRTEAKLRSQEPGQCRATAPQSSPAPLEYTQQPVQPVSLSQSPPLERNRIEVGLQGSHIPITATSSSCTSLNRNKMGNPQRYSRREPSHEEASWRIRCICGAREEGNDDTEAWIGCDECGNWQHNVCMGVSIYTEEIPRKYKCEDCAPEAHKELLDGMDRGERPWEKRRRDHDLANETNPNKKRKEKDGNPSPASGDHEIADVSAETTRNSKPFPLTGQCHHYVRRSDVDWDIQKYWSQRYSIFSRYDEGVYMTDDSWFGVTPEPVAKKVSDDLRALASPSKTILIDLFAGAGGNSIAFALSGRWSTIIAVEKDTSVIACAQHNAAIYGVSDKITWINDDCFTYLSSNASSIDPSKTVVFASPPWGGPGYTSDEIFNLSTMQPYSIKQIHSACQSMDSALYLPRTSDLRQIARLAPEGKKVEVVQYCMEGASKALVAYIPASPVTAS